MKKSLRWRFRMWMARTFDKFLWATDPFYRDMLRAQARESRIQVRAVMRKYYPWLTKGDDA